MVSRKKIIRSATIAASLTTFCSGLLSELREEGYDVIAVASPDPALEDLERQEGVRALPLPMNRHIAPLQDMKALFRMIRLLRRERPDMIHSITPKAGLISMLAARLCRVPLRVHTFTGLVFPTSSGWKRRILMLTDKLTCACASHIIPEGEGVKSDLINHSITTKPLKVLGYGNIKGIDLDYFNPDLEEIEAKAAEIRRDDLLTFIFVGRLVGDKGINELVEAFAGVNRRYPATRLILVGPYESDLDPLKPSTLHTIKTLPAIEAVGCRKDVRHWLKASDVFICPSYREGFPNVVIEAGAMSLPSIVTDINGAREIIIQDKNGIIVPSKNVDALSEAMCRFIENPDLRKRLGENARPLIASRYEQSFVRNCLKEFYRQIQTPAH